MRGLARGERAHEAAGAVAGGVVDDDHLVVDLRRLEHGGSRASTVAPTESASLRAGITTESFTRRQRSALASWISRSISSMP